jgi:hypothetical protein
VPAFFPDRGEAFCSSRYRFDVRAAHFDCEAGTRSVIGEPPEWTLWALVGPSLFVILLPALKR